MCPSDFLCKCAAFFFIISMIETVETLKNLKSNRRTLQTLDVSSGGGRPLVADLQPSGAPLSLFLSQVSSSSVVFGSSSQSRLSSDMESC